MQTLPPVDISQIDLTGITDCTKTILTNAQTFSAAAGKLQQTMTELQPKVEAELEAAQKLQEKLPEGGIGTVTDKVQALNNGMQMLNGSDRNIVQWNRRTGYGNRCISGSGIGNPIFAGWIYSAWFV